MSQPDPLPIEEDRILAPLTSWRIGGPARYFAEPEDARTLEECVRFAIERGLPVLALGGGSNLLVADAGYPGLVLRVGERTWRMEAAGEEALLRAGARAPLATLARALAHDGWAGLEWAEGIPGTVGGAVVGNAGAYGGDFASVCHCVETWSIDRGWQERPAAALEFGYRRSRLSGQDPTHEFVLGPTVRLRRGDPEHLRARIREMAADRKARTPAGLSCGSVFRNPPGDAAGRLIEQAGLKGAVVGGAQISRQHANYILNTGGATAHDVRALIDRARHEVARQCGVELELEVRLVGFAGG